MAYCRNCGSKVVDGAKFCQKCGTPVVVIPYESGAQPQRQQEFEGKLYKCPNCGETLRSFARNCPICGYELRGVKSTGAVREFALKLEAIEAQREYEKPRGIFSSSANQNRISKTDEQKISLIHNFAVPNTIEDMLEFMILATSNVNYKTYETNSYVSTKTETALNDAWVSKIEQVYKKAKISYGNDEDFQKIEELYISCNNRINTTKRKNTLKYVLLVGGLFGFSVLCFLLIWILSSNDKKAKIEHLEQVESEAREAMDSKEYKKALLLAESLVYGKKDSDTGREWDAKRKILYEEIIDKAEADGVHLEQPIEEKETEEKHSDLFKQLSDKFTKDSKES